MKGRDVIDESSLFHLKKNQVFIIIVKHAVLVWDSYYNF